jgi:hypothetical protein
VTGPSPAWTPAGSWELVPYDDLSNGFVFRADPPGVVVLSRLSMLALDLSTRHADAAERFAAVLGGRAGTAELYQRSVTALESSGLIEPASQPEASAPEAADTHA